MKNSNGEDSPGCLWYVLFIFLMFAIPYIPGVNQDRREHPTRIVPTPTAPSSRLTTEDCERIQEEELEDACWDAIDDLERSDRDYYEDAYDIDDYADFEEPNEDNFDQRYVEP